jgi:hypothetical protein
MLTALTEFESPERKVFRLTSSVVVMWAGDAAFLRGILNRLGAEIDARGPDSPLEVEEAADLFLAHYSKARTREIDQNVLAPFGLTTDSFRKVQRNMSKGLVTALASDIASYSPPRIEALIVGMDSRKAHIYGFDNSNRGAGTIRCHDSIGFHAIGAGDIQSDAQLTLARYGPSRPLADALFLVYLAKKRSEVAPGVGRHTDMFFFDKQAGTPGVYKILERDDKIQLDGFFDLVRSAEVNAVSNALRKTTEWHKARAPLPPPPSGPSGPITVTGYAPTIHTTKIYPPSVRQEPPPPGGPQGPTGAHGPSGPKPQ